MSDSRYSKLIARKCASADGYCAAFEPSSLYVKSFSPQVYSSRWVSKHEVLVKGIVEGPRQGKRKSRLFAKEDSFPSPTFIMEQWCSTNRAQFVRHIRSSKSRYFYREIFIIGNGLIACKTTLIREVTAPPKLRNGRTNAVATFVRSLRPTIKHWPSIIPQYARLPSLG